MAVCVYDNPATFSRECWSNGHLQASYCADAMHRKDWPPPDLCLHIGANCGPWKEGQILGDKEAMEPRRGQSLR
jgi:hypothetical protein